MTSLAARVNLGLYLMIVACAGGCASGGQQAETQPDVLVQLYDREDLAWPGTVAELHERVGQELERRGAELVSVTKERAKYRVSAGSEQVEFVLRHRDTGLTFKATGEVRERSQGIAWFRLLQCKRALRDAIAKAPAAREPSGAEPSDAGATPDATSTESLPTNPEGETP